MLMQLGHVHIVKEWTFCCVLGEFAHTEALYHHIWSHKSVCMKHACRVDMTGHRAMQHVRIQSNPHQVRLPYLEEDYVV